MGYKWNLSVMFMCLAMMISSCSFDKKSELDIDSFEQVISKQTVDYGSSADTVIEVSANTELKFCGGQSLSLEYDLGEGGYMYCARGYGLDALGSTWEAPPPDEIKWQNYAGWSFMVYGAKTGQIAFDVKDAGNELHRYLFTDDFEGWQEIIVPFSEFKKRDDWQPSIADGNGNLDFPLKSYQFEVKTPGKGQLYFDCVRLKKIMM